MNLAMWGKTEQVKTIGKNLFSSLYDEYTLPSNYYICPLVLEQGETYTVNLKSISKIQNVVVYIVKSGNKYPFESIVASLLNLSDTLGNIKVSFAVDETFTAPAIAIYAESKESFDSLFEAKEIQLEKNSVATSYEPYSGGFLSPSPDWEQPIEVTDQPVTVTIKGGTEQQSITLVPPRPLTKWDKLEKVDGVWRWMYQSRWIESYVDENITGEYISTTGGLNAGAKVCYKSTPEYTPLPQPIQDKLNALTMCAGTTEVINDGGCNMELTYTVDTQSYVDTKIAEVSKAII